MELEKIVTKNNSSKAINKMLSKSIYSKSIKEGLDKVIIDFNSKIAGIIDSILIERELDLNTGYLGSSYSIEGENIYYIDKDGNTTRIITFMPFNLDTSYLPNNDFNIRIKRVYY